MKTEDFLEMLNGIDDRYIYDAGEALEDYHKASTQYATAAQLRKKQADEKISSWEAEEALKPRIIKTESSSKSGSFLKKVIIAAAAFACVVGVFVGVNSKPQMIPSDSTSSEGSASEFRCVSMLEIGGPEAAILNSTEDEIRNAINVCDNLSAADTLYINAPEKAKVYEFTSFSVADYSGKSAYTPKIQIEDFRRMFAYLLPEHELREDCFTYQWTEGVEDVNNLPEKPEVEEGLVKDFTKPDGLISIQYDERDKVEDSPVIIVPGYDIGSGYLELNKGKLVGYVQANNLLEEPLDARDYYLDRHFPVVGKYAPTSEKSFKLLDKEVKICDAVRFYEDYINNMPIAQGNEKNILTKVHSVTVLQIGEIYGYYFETQMQLSGVNYDVRYTGNIASYGMDNLHGQSGRGFMFESDCVDIVEGAFLHDNLMNVENVEKILSAEEAISKFSDGLTKSVKFTVNSLEFVYYESYVPDENGYLNTQTNEAKVVPAWKLTAYNPNDKLTYFCYIDAADGSDFRYFTIPEEIAYD